MARILLQCHDIIGKTMAGPAIRYWEFAKALSKHHTVTLQAEFNDGVESSEFTLLPLKKPLDYSHYDITVSQFFSPLTAIKAKQKGVKLILDAYDPEALEHLEIFKKQSPIIRSFQNDKIVNTVTFSFEMADGFLCANEKQRDLWTGFLLSLKKIDPKLYDRDNTLKKTIGTVPFGISNEPPIKKSQGFKEQFFLKSTDKLIIWGGGIWNWFDPLTLISAMKILSDKRADIKLVFMGIIHPNAAAMPAMSMAYETKKLADTFSLTGKTVFFNDTWIPYNERANYLLEADIGISTHLEHLETRYSFRTRLLDYIWAELPIIATEGDTFADLIESEQLGLTVAPNDAAAIAKAIEEIIDQPERIRLYKENLRNLKQIFYWENVTKPLEEMIDYLKSQGKSQLQFSNVIKAFGCYLKKLKPYSLYFRGKSYLKRLIQS